jgi:hypothetical protein
VFVLAAPRQVRVLEDAGQVSVEADPEDRRPPPAALSLDVVWHTVMA